MENQYYYTLSGQEFGPVPMSTIYGLIDNGTLQPGDRYRAFGETWDSVAALSARSDVLAGYWESQESSPDAAAETGNDTKNLTAPNLEMQRLFLECVNQQRAHVTEGRTHVDGSVAVPHVGRTLCAILQKTLMLPFRIARTAMGSIGSNVFARWRQHPRRRSFPGSVNAAFNSVFARITDLTKTPSVRMTLLVTCLCVLAVWVPRFWITQERVYSEIATTMEKFLELRESEADEETWTHFRQRSLTRLRKLVPDLEAKADVVDPISLALLGLARDDLPELLSKPVSTSEALTVRIETRLTEVRALLWEE